MNRIGPIAALASALLFGMAVPAAKWLIADFAPWTLAGLLYAGSGVGLTVFRWISRKTVILPRGREWLWLLSAVLLGGMVGPVLLLWGLKEAEAASTSLLLNTEAVFTTLIAWFWFREHFDLRIAIGMLAILSGAMVLSWSEGADLVGGWGTLPVLGACLCWAIDNNLTRKVAHLDAVWLASIKGLVAGSANLALAFYLGETMPEAEQLGAAFLLGWLSYGLSLTFFVVSLRRLGTARTGAYFSIAPLFGAVLSILFLDEAMSPRLMVAGVLMMSGVWLHLTEKHSHEHTHDELEHEHEHIHDEHHQHSHDEPWVPGEPHTHWHRHVPITHSHPHFPDIHHRHGH